MLPINNLPLYEKTVPSTGQVIHYRPFTVKEQRILLLAQQSGEESQMVTAIKQILELCVKEKIDVNELALFDIEYLFLNIAAKSSGEIVDLTIKCQHCSGENDYSVNIMDIKLEMPQKDSNIIKLDGDIGIAFKYPNVEIFNKLSSLGNDFDSMMEILISCIDYIYDTESVYYAKDSTHEELLSFIESLTLDQIQNVQQWFETIPEVKDEVSFVCKHCGKDNQLVIKGIKSFL